MADVLVYLVTFVTAMNWLETLYKLAQHSSLKKSIVKFIKIRRRARRQRLPRRSLKKLPTCKFSKGNPHETCAICLEDYLEGERLRVLPCAHAYHAACIDPWLTLNRRVCPVCKRRVVVAGERPRRQIDSSELDTEPLLADPPATQGYTFDEQSENPIARAMRFITRLRARNAHGEHAEGYTFDEQSENPIARAMRFMTRLRARNARGEHAEMVKIMKSRGRARWQRLPRRSLKKLLICIFSKGDPQESCAICLEEYHEGDRLRVLPCAHAYHAACIDPWLTLNRRVCPVCKRRVVVAGERPRRHIDSSESDTEPLLADPPATQGGTFNGQIENPFARATRFMARHRARNVRGNNVEMVKIIKTRGRARRQRLPRRSLKKLPTCKFSKGDPHETCAICLEDYLEGERLRVLPCAHAYHAACIDPWLTLNRRVCPVCKRRVVVAGERPRRQIDSSESSAEPLLADLPAMQGGTFDEQSENPFARATRFMARLRARNAGGDNAEVASSPSEDNDRMNGNNDENGNTEETAPLVQASVTSEGGGRGRRARRARDQRRARPRARGHAAVTTGNYPTNTTEAGEIGAPAIPITALQHILSDTQFRRIMDAAREMFQGQMNPRQ